MIRWLLLMNAVNRLHFTVPHAQRHRSMLWGLLVSLGLSLVHTGCQTIPTRTYEVRQRAFTYEPSSLVRDYQEEYAYIEQRRLSVLNGDQIRPLDFVPLANRVPTHLTGLAFSGGGIRSATFHLGMLQA